MDQVITFDKSLQTRLQEYEEVFSGLETLPFSKIQTEWSYYLELTLDSNGWQAIWKIPRLKCEELKIPFPCVVLVLVLSVSYSDLTALVRILAVLDDIHLPEKQYVPLIQLWPTKEQDKSIGLNLNTTANTMDMLRFFYIHVLMPWDEDTDLADWKGTHLISRLRLFYDLKNGNIPKATTEHIYALLNEARRLNSKRQIIASTYDGFDSDVESENDITNNNLENLLEINVRLIEIQHEMYLLENEMFRKVIIKRQESPQISSAGGDIWLIFKKGTANECKRFLDSIENLYPNQDLRFATDFMSKLQSANSQDTILLSSAEHTIRNEGALIENLKVIGIGDNVKLISLGDSVMFDFMGDDSVFENLTIDARTAHCAILVRKGNVIFNNCKIIGHQTPTTHQGILVLNGAKLTITSCEIMGFSMAIVGNSGSIINIQDSVIKESSFGLKIYDNCHLGLYNTTVKDCREYGIVIETEQNYSSDRIVGNFDTLNLVSYFVTESIQGENNQKGDVIIKKNNVEARENLFENPDVDPTILGNSDDEMNFDLNDTVLEVKQLEDDPCCLK